MDPIIVKRHGERWAVQDGGETAPIEEYDTRELAEVAARQRAEGSGREVLVDESAGDEQLGQVTEPDVEGERPTEGDAGIHERTGGAATGTEMPREGQAGL
jgi:hypothetical protein